MKHLGLVTIGQTPRPDFESVFARYVPGASLRLEGALDGLPSHEIDRLSDPRDDYPLLVRLANGSTALVPLRRIVPRVQECAQRLAAEGCPLVVVLCAGAFPDIACDVPVLMPGRILPGVVASIFRTRHVGVVTPVAGQANVARLKWEGDGFTVKVAWASPLRDEELAPAAQAMRDPSLECVVLDCMGHDERYKREFARLCERPVISAQSIVARVAGELMG
jgi:protein AroM